LNVAGGLRISEPAADLAVAAALVSALAKRPVPSDMVVFGEIGLAGEVRAVSHMETRLKEAAKLGFTRALVPMRPQRGKERGYPVIPGIAIDEVGQVSDLVARLGADAPQPRQGGRN
jgi:DNA repair protein RadA/Sms